MVGLIDDGCCDLVHDLLINNNKGRALTFKEVWMRRLTLGNRRIWSGKCEPRPLNLNNLVLVLGLARTYPGSCLVTFQFPLSLSLSRFL
jgi:hypothetical protein